MKVSHLDRTRKLLARSTIGRGGGLVVDGIICSRHKRPRENVLAWRARIRNRLTYLLRGNGLLACLAKLLNRLVVVTQILLTTDENDGQALAEVQDLRDPL